MRQAIGKEKNIQGLGKIANAEADYNKGTSAIQVNISAKITSCIKIMEYHSN